MDPQNQFASPYLAMGNNPVMLVDPDGELAWFVIPIIVGAVTGGMNVATNWSAIQAAGGGWSSFGVAAASFGIGFAAGAGATLGAGAAAPALTAALGTGAYSGAALGALGGGISGFALGAGNTWMNGGSFFNGLGAGAAGAGMGALAGGVTGGTFSGVKSLIQGRNFLTGLPKAGAGPNYSNYDLGVERPKLGSDLPKRELPSFEGPINRASPNAGGNQDIGNIRIDLEMGRAAKGGGMYIPKTPLAQQKVAGWDIPLPDPLAGKFPHTTLGGKIGSNGILYRQSATFTGGSWPSANGNIVPWSRVDWTTHGRPLVHPNPHQHIFNFNNGINWRYGKAVPFP